jgi:hypothetical protein
MDLRIFRDVVWQGMKFLSAGFAPAALGGNTHTIERQREAEQQLEVAKVTRRRMSMLSSTTLPPGNESTKHSNNANNTSSNHAPAGDSETPSSPAIRPRFDTFEALPSSPDGAGAAGVRTITLSMVEQSNAAAGKEVEHDDNF